MSTHFVIIGGGPAGNTAATHAARLGAQVTVVERDVIGGAAHLWDCIPSKTMIATGGAMSFTRRIQGMGLEEQEAEVDPAALAYMRGRLTQAPRDSGHGLALVQKYCTTRELQEKAVAALQFKCDLLWAQLDAIYYHCVAPTRPGAA